MILEDAAPRVTKSSPRIFFSLSFPSKSLPLGERKKRGEKLRKMAAARVVGSGPVLSRPVTFVTGNSKKLEEVRAILGQSIPFQSLKLDCTHSLSKNPHFLFLKPSLSLIICFFCDFSYST